MGEWYGQVGEQASEDEVLGRGVERGPENDEHELRDEDADGLGLVDGDGAADEAGHPDGARPHHHEAELRPPIFEEGLVGVKDTQREDDDGKEDGKSLDGIVGVE